jgi:phosphomannomutase
MLTIFEKSLQKWVRFDALGSISEHPGAADAHRRKVLALSVVDVPAIRARKFKVVLDCAHGAGAVVTEGLLRELGCEVTVLSGEPTGLFSRGAEPVPENLGELCEQVKRLGAYVGFAHDPDADRLAIVNELGVPTGEEYTLALGADHVLGLHQGPVVTNLSTSNLTAEVARMHGVPLFRTPVGEAHVVQGMREQQAIVGGEGNGGLILPECHMGRDGSAAVAVILSGLAARKISLSEWAAKIPAFAILKCKEEGSVPVERLRQAMREAFADGSFDERDGIRVDYDDAWVQLRASGTEPISRILAEGKTSARARELCDRAQAAWRAAVEV